MNKKQFRLVSNLNQFLHTEVKDIPGSDKQFDSGCYAPWDVITFLSFHKKRTGSVSSSKGGNPGAELQSHLPQPKPLNLRHRFNCKIQSDVYKMTGTPFIPLPLIPLKTFL